MSEKIFKKIVMLPNVGGQYLALQITLFHALKYTVNPIYFFNPIQYKKDGKRKKVFDKWNYII